MSPPRLSHREHLPRSKVAMVLGAFAVGLGAGVGVEFFTHSEPLGAIVAATVGLVVLSLLNRRHPPSARL